MIIKKIPTYVGGRVRRQSTHPISFPSIRALGQTCKHLHYRNCFLSDEQNAPVCVDVKKFLLSEVKFRTHCSAARR